MARLFSVGDRSGHHCDCHDHHDLCADLRHDWSGDDCDSSGEHHRHRRRRKKRLIPVGRIEVDCTPVTFKTPGQVTAVVSCPSAVTTTVTVPQTVTLQVPLGFGCSACIPLTQPVEVPVTNIINVPPVVTPVPRVVCPPGFLGTVFAV